MKKPLLILIVLFFSFNIAAQSGFVIDTTATAPLCQTPQVSPNLSLLSQVKSLNTDPTVYARIYIHVLRKEQAPYGGQTVEGVNRLVQNLYEAFDPIELHFAWNGQINYIYDDGFYYPNQSNVGTLIDTYNHTNGIDIFLVDDTSGPITYSHGVGMSSAIVFGGYLNASFNGGHDNSLTTLTRTGYIAHLMGHVLFLFHTHHGSHPNDGGCPEYVDGSNSTTCGDFIIDTPADPNLYTHPYGFNVTPDCNYNPTYYVPNPPTDDHGDFYLPDTTNIMSNTTVSCMDHFTYGQSKIMKGAILFLPELQPVELQDYTYIRADKDCFVCESKLFTVYSNSTISDLEIQTSANIEASIISTTTNSMTVQISSLIGGSEGSQGYFDVVNTGGGIELFLAKQRLWVGKPQTIPNELLFGTGDDNVPIMPGDTAAHVLGSLDHRFGGFEYNGWDYPQPAAPYNGMPDDTLWQYRDFNQFFNIQNSDAGDDTGWVRGYGVNPCGTGDYGINNEICVKNNGDGAPECDPEPLPIIYYPNPADSILEVDLSLQEYDSYTVVIYDENQVIQYSEQSTNVVKTIDVLSLSNGTYYLHVYDDSEVLHSSILIINH